MLLVANDLYEDFCAVAGKVKKVGRTDLVLGIFVLFAQCCGSLFYVSVYRQRHSLLSRFVHLYLPSFSLGNGISA